jgi:TorA maturation chaperone TorD
MEVLRAREIPELRDALNRLDAGTELLAAAEQTAEHIHDCEVSELGRRYDLVFDASAGLRCPSNETSVISDTPSEQMTRTYALADIAGFYRAFGVEIAPGSGQPDHIAAELEFMHLLAVKELLARAEADGAENPQICHEAACSFLRDHLGRWSGRFAEQLEEAEADPLYTAAGRLLDGFVALDAEALDAGL